MHAVLLPVAVILFKTLFSAVTGGLAVATKAMGALKWSQPALTPVTAIPVTDWDFVDIDAVLVIRKLTLSVTKDDRIVIRGVPTATKHTNGLFLIDHTEIVGIVSVGSG